MIQDAACTVYLANSMTTASLYKSKSSSHRKDVLNAYSKDLRTSLTKLHITDYKLT